MNIKLWIYASVFVTVLLTGTSAVWAVCPDGKSEVIMYTPSGNANTLCVSDNALPGIENANEQHKDKLDICEVATCPCWTAETLENLPDINIDEQPEGWPLCSESYNRTFFTIYDPQEPTFESVIAVYDAPDYYQENRVCGILPGSDFSSWPWSTYYVREGDLTYAEAIACADILRASKWWNMCAEILH